MPIFEYICKDCGKSFERIVPRHDSQTECPHCNGSKLEKQLSVFAVAGSRAEMSADAGCGRCGAAQPGMCQMMD